MCSEGRLPAGCMPGSLYSADWGLFFSVVRVSECPNFNKCIRDERHMSFLTHTMHRMALSMCRMMCQETVEAFTKR